MREAPAVVPAPPSSAQPAPPPAPQPVAVEPPLSHSVPFEVAANRLNAGDAITITEVHGTKPGFEAGGVYRVRGRYALTSQERASLLLSGTATRPGAQASASSRQPVERGSGTFELVEAMPHAGPLMVSFYPQTGGESFGHISFRQRRSSKVAASERIPGWSLAVRSIEDYRISRDHGTSKSGAVSVRLESIAERPKRWGSLTQSVDAGLYRKKRVRFSAALKTALTDQASAGLFMQIVRENQQRSVSDDMSDRRVLAITDWNRYEVVLDTPADATEIHFGLLLWGKGIAWIDDTKLEIVAASVPVTGSFRNLHNGDFELPGDWPLGWSMSEGGRLSHEVAVDRSIRHGGQASARLRARNGPRSYETLAAYLAAAGYHGKRLRLTAFTRGESIGARGDFWIRVKANDSPSSGPGLGGGSCRLSGTFDWKKCEIVFDVPKAGVEIQLGIGLDGPGTIWLDDVSLTPVARNVALTQGTLDDVKGPRNLDFEQ